MSRIVIACYRPKAGQQDALRSLIRDHVSTLRGIGLVTDRAPVTMEAADGTILEVFEWASVEAIETAHGHPVVLKMWERFEAVCDYVPLAQVPEASQMFSNYTPIAVNS
jgi:hypothetical protein